jgi:deferrochelatase/peroxidase EfeB
MDTRPVADAHKQWPSWKLAPPIDARVQGLVVSGFGDLATGRALLLEFQWADGAANPGAWLKTLTDTAPITSARPPDKTDPNAQSRAAALAFTWTGLQRMGLPETALASFSRPFVEGMFQEDRLRRLGDRRSGQWLETVLPAGPLWSANTPLRPAISTLPGAFDVPDGGHQEEHVTTPLTVHALLLLYTRDEGSANGWRDQVEAALAAHQVAIVRTLELVLDVEKSGISREHFGFADGLSQPAPYDETGFVTLDGKKVGTSEMAKDPVQGVPLGEFLIGYLNGHHENAPGPVTPGENDPRPEQADLPPHPTAEGFYDLGLGGSYMAVRELRQDVAAFWNAMDRNAAAIREHDPANSAEVTAEWIAERVIGRDRQGRLLCPGSKLALDALGLPDSNFLFYDRDPQGVGCPPGSHVRRGNPRDSLAPDPSQKATLLQAANNHRIMRRARKFGTKIADYRVDDGAERGLLFMCLNTDIARQFEFVQQTWLLNSDFATLRSEVDPLVGPKGTMTIRQQPLRRTVHVDTFVQAAGGDYFFLPSLPALRYLAML